MKIRTINLNTRKVKAFFDNLLTVRLALIRESMQDGTYPETFLNGPGADIQRDIWDCFFKKAAREAFSALLQGRRIRA